MIYLYVTLKVRSLIQEFRDENLPADARYMENESQINESLTVFLII
jgi:hypothetical protein